MRSACRFRPAFPPRSCNQRQRRRWTCCAATPAPTAHSQHRSVLPASVCRCPAWRRRWSAWCRLEGGEYFDQAQRAGRGVLVATAHLGNWELSAFAHALMTAPMNIVVRPLDNPLIDALVERRRALTGNRPIGKKDFARAILKALAANQAVGILLADR